MAKFLVRKVGNKPHAMHKEPLGGLEVSEVKVDSDTISHSLR